MKSIFTKSYPIKLALLFAFILSYIYASATPTITIIGKDSIKHQVNTTYNDSGATAIDSANNDITANIVVTGTVNSNTFGTYKITYTITDGNGIKTSVIRTVVVTDCIPPTLSTIMGTEVMTVCINDLTFTEPAVTATDNYFTTVNITRTGTYDITKLGDYTITYTATDGAGNKAIYTRVIRIKICKGPKVITTGVQNVYFVNDPIDLLKGIYVSDAYYPTSDFINNRNGCKLEIKASNVDNSKPGYYQVLYEATNGGGLKSEPDLLLIWVRQRSMGVVENQQKNSIKVYPNPTTDKITIALNTNGNYTAALSTIEGKTILEKNISSINNTISVNNLEVGIYYLTVKGLNTLYTQKVIITK